MTGSIARPNVVPLRDPVSAPRLDEALLASVDITDLGDEIMVAGFEITAAGQTLRIWGRPVASALSEIDSAIKTLTKHYHTLKAIEERFGS